MSVNHSTREPVEGALGATITSGQGKVFSSPGLPPADLDETVAPSRPVLDTGADTRREPGAPISGIDQTAIGDPSQPPLRTAIEDVIFERRGEPGRIQRFEVLRRLGTGGMGVVYAAYDWELERRLAIKVVRDDSASEASRRRMKREAQAMAKVSHPNVVQVYEVGEWAGQMYVAMEYIKGKNLAEWLQAEERTWQEILEVYVQAGRGLAAAHRQGVVHRDFKPENVLVDTDNRARVLDFGLARAEGLASASDSESALIGHRYTEESVNLTLAGAIMGTPAFMSPEQHLGRLADARSDQFSFCVALYVGLYNQPPFAGETLAELGVSVTTGELRPPPSDTHVPAWVFAALKVGLATSPEGRYPSMDTLLAAVSPDAVAVPRRRWLWPAALVGASALAVVVTLTIVGGDEPASEDLEAVERYTREAHDAARRRHWVYPDREDPRDTAYNRVVLLEHLDGAVAERGLAAAAELRVAFSEQLIALGDRYFADPPSRPWARDFYVQALVFTPEDLHASHLAHISVGRLAELTDRAGGGTFTPDEIIAAEPLWILADPDPVHARDEALAFLADPDRGSARDRIDLARAFRSSGVLGDADLEPKQEDPPLLAQADPPPTPEPAPEPVVTPEPPPETPPGKAPRRGGKLDKAAVVPPTKEAPPVTPPPPEEDMAAKVDPEASRALASQADAARRRGDTAEAEQLYNKALDLWNGNAAALMGISDIAFERGNFDRAVKYAEKAVRAEPASGEYQIRLGDAYFKVFRYSDAQQRYKKAAELGHPKAAERLTRVQDKVGG